MAMWPTADAYEELISNHQEDIAKLRAENERLTEENLLLQGRVGIAEEVKERAIRFEAALEKITKMGRVCPEFELCDHPWCSDSCGAVLTALEALGSPSEGEET